MWNSWWSCRKMFDATFFLRQCIFYYASCVLSDAGRGHAEWTYNLLSTHCLLIARCSVVLWIHCSTSLDLLVWRNSTQLTQSRWTRTHSPLHTLKYSWPPRCSGTNINGKWCFWNRSLPEMMSVGKAAVKCGYILCIFSELGNSVLE